MHDPLMGIRITESLIDLFADLEDDDFQKNTDHDHQNLIVYES
jgi:hypothetical protein